MTITNAELIAALTTIAMLAVPTGDALARQWT
jgi:hypothetical protein